MAQGPEHVEAALKHANNSCPGPDGIPYGCWSRCPQNALALHAVCNLMLDDSPHYPPDGFNIAHLCCLPKKPERVDETMGDIFEAQGTRPLSVVNTDNRLIAASGKAARSRRCSS